MKATQILRRCYYLCRQYPRGHTSMQLNLATKLILPQVSMGFAGFKREFYRITRIQAFRRKGVLLRWRLGRTSVFWDAKDALLCESQWAGRSFGPCLSLFSLLEKRKVCGCTSLWASGQGGDPVSHQYSPPPHRIAVEAANLLPRTRRARPARHARQAG